MKCPVCKDPSLQLAERQGIEIDYCPSCRGVWLDRGELDKLIERSASQAQPDRQPERTRIPDHERSGYHRKHKSWLSEIFD